MAVVNENTINTNGHNIDAIQKGWGVLTSDGQKVADVWGISRSLGVSDSYVIAQKKVLFMKKDMFIPSAAIADVKDHSVVLNCSKDQLKGNSWNEPPK